MGTALGRDRKKILEARFIVTIAQQPRLREMTTATETILLGMSFMVIAACANTQTAHPHAGPASSAEATAPARGTGDFASWRTWTQTNSKRFLSKGHGGKWVDVYVPTQLAGVYRNGTRPVAAGFEVAKAGYTDQAGTQFAALTVMKKMQSGYDPDHGDWYYAVFGEDGQTVRMEGKVPMCIRCHQQAADRDYLFGASAEPH